MQGRSERRTESLSPASAVSPAARYSILPSRDRESSGRRCDVVSFALSDRSKASSDRSEPPVCDTLLNDLLQLSPWLGGTACPISGPVCARVGSHRPDGHCRGSRSGHDPSRLGPAPPERTCPGHPLLAHRPARGDRVGPVAGGPWHTRRGRSSWAGERLRRASR